MVEVTPEQALWLFGLLARHGECVQAELKPPMKDADCEPLVAARLIGYEKRGKTSKTTTIRLEDAGWAWAGNNLSGPLPTGHTTLQFMMTRLGEYLTRSGLTLADFIGGKPAPLVVQKEVAPKSAKVRKSKANAPNSPTGGAAAQPQSDPVAATAATLEAKPKKSAKPKKPKTASDGPETGPAAVPGTAKARDPETRAKVASSKAKTNKPGVAVVTDQGTQTDARKRILQAYAEITGGRTGTEVNLSAIRARLTDLDRSIVDAALAQLHLESGKAQLMELASTRDLSDADIAAALKFKGAIFHVLWIEA
jgi:hypothetical protein